MNVQDAHQQIKTFCNGEAGIGITLNLLQKLLDQQILFYTSKLKDAKSEQKFKGKFDVSFEGDFDKTYTTSKFDKKYNINGTKYEPLFVISDIILKITGKLSFRKNDGSVDTFAVVSFKIKFNEIISKIIYRGNQIAFSLVSNDSYELENEYEELWKRQDIRDYFEYEHQFNEQDWLNLRILFKSISIFSSGYIAESFVESLVFPDIFSIFNGIKFNENARLGFSDNLDLIIFSSDAEINLLKCPNDNPNGTVRTSSTTSKIEDVSEETGEMYKKIIVSTEINQDSPALEYPRRIDGQEIGNDIPNLKTGDIFLHTPTKLLEYNFKIVKPAITLSDSGNLGPLHWRYSVSTSIKKVTLKLVRAWPIQFRLLLPAEITGQAGAGVKIGSIRYEAVGGLFDGDVEPFEVQFMIYLDWFRREIVFTSKIERIIGKRFSFRSWPKLDFPLDQMLDFILARASEFAVTQQAERVLSTTRISIANLHLLERLGTLKNGLAGCSDKEDDTTIGIQLEI